MQPVWREFEERPGFVVGLDLGTARDFTAITVVDVVARVEREATGRIADRRFEPKFEMLHLQRLRLGVEYPEVVDVVSKLIIALPARKRRPELVVDSTGVGLPVLHMLRKARLRPIGVTITGGHAETSAGDMHNVPKRNLISSLQVAFQSGRLRVAAELPDAATLIDELQNFKVKINVNGHDSYEAWRESAHDDLVLSASIAVWFAEREQRYTTTITPLQI